MTTPLDLDFLEHGQHARQEAAQRRTRQVVALSTVVTVVWVIYMAESDQWDRVLDRWVAAVTMVAGSFVAGSTPQGGGAVAFPVFTKVLNIDSAVARSFSLLVQSVGMGCAALSIVITRRRVAWSAVAKITPAAVVAFLATIILTGDRSQPFWPSRLPAPYVKVTFTVIVAVLGMLMYLSWKKAVRYNHSVAPSGPNITATLLMAGFIGGCAAGLVGSGVDVLAYLCCVVIFGLDDRIGVPTSVIPMAVVSVVGFICFGLVDQQLNVTVIGDNVVSVGSHVVDLPAERYDLFGLWLAAVPVVAWGAPAGSMMAGVVKQRHLVILIMVLAGLEVVTTILFLDDLRSSPALVAYGVALLAIVFIALLALVKHRGRLFSVHSPGPDTTIRRGDLSITRDHAPKIGER